MFASPNGSTHMRWDGTRLSVEPRCWLLAASYGNLTAQLMLGSGVRMPHRIFLSSTFVDLVEFRRAVQDGIRQLGALDISMEYFGARDERPVEECVRLIQRETDVFVGIYAHRYGYVPEASEASIVELEYRAASDALLPRLIYLVDEATPWLPAHIDTGESAKRLQAFKEHVRKRHICQAFSSKDHLATRVVADISRHIAMLDLNRAHTAQELVDTETYSLLGPSQERVADFSDIYDQIRSHCRDLYLTHEVAPSSVPGQQFDVYIRLAKHGSRNLDEVYDAEFFLGPYWDNKIFRANDSSQTGTIGIKTSAYDSFLCICRVQMRDSTVVQLHRYIDLDSTAASLAGA